MLLVPYLPILGLYGTNRIIRIIMGIMDTEFLRDIIQELPSVPRKEAALTHSDKMKAAHANRVKDSVDGRKNADGSRCLEITAIQSNHQEMIRLSLLGFKNKDIALKLDISACQVSTVLNSKIVKDRMLELSKQRDNFFITAKQNIVELLPRAVKVLSDGLDDCEIPTMDKFKIAKHVLSVSGLSPVHAIQSSIDIRLTQNDLEEIKKRAKAIDIPAVLVEQVS